MGHWTMTIYSIADGGAVSASLSSLPLKGYAISEDVLVIKGKGIFFDGKFVGESGG